MAEVHEAGDVFCSFKTPRCASTIGLCKMFKKEAELVFVYNYSCF